VAAETRANKSWRLQRNLALRQQATELPKRFSVAPITHAGSSMKPPPSPSPTTSTVVSDTSSSSNSHRFEEQIAIFQTEFTETSFIQFHAYEPLLFAADGRDHIGLWNYEEGEKLNVFSNQNARGTRISSLHLMNDMHVSLLLTAADDGVVRIWRNAHLNKGQELVSAFSAFPRLPRGAAPSPGLVLDWQQYTGHILAGGSIDMIRVWDVEREQCVVEMPLSPVLQQSLPVGSQPTPPQVGILSGMSGSLTAPSPSLLPNSIGAAPSSFVLGGTGATYSLNTNSISSTLDGGLFAAGCNDGSVRVFDIRQPQPCVEFLCGKLCRVCCLSCWFLCTDWLPS
jgi:WD40 repeat protein